MSFKFFVDRRRMYALIQSFIWLNSSAVFSAETHSKVQSNYFKNVQAYHDALKSDPANEAAVTKAAMDVQNSIDSAALDPIETSNIVSFEMNKINAQDIGGAGVKAVDLLQQMILLERIQIGQNKAIIQMLSEYAYRKPPESNRVEKSTPVK